MTHLLSNTDSHKPAVTCVPLSLSLSPSPSPCLPVCVLSLFCVRKMLVKTLGAQKCSCCSVYVLMLLLLLVPSRAKAHISSGSSGPAPADPGLVMVNKCCEKFEIHVDSECQQVNQTDYFQPMFTSYGGDQNRPVRFKFIIGIPNCGSMQMWPIYHYAGSSDKLVLLDDGKLRHYTNAEDEAAEQRGVQTDYEDDIGGRREPLYHDYDQGLYCIDRATSSTGEEHVLFAKICLAKKEIKWSDSNFLLRKILNPIFHGISLIILLVIAIIYFILPTLRDLVGNIVTTIAVCLMVSQAADLVRIFTELTNHVSFIVADIILCFSLLAAFFWLNSFGYYIWKTFRSRNVFLRVTDGRKYCYYSAYAWGCTGTMAALAVFAHFFLDADSYKQEQMVGEQETIGWLGICIFFAPIACTIVVNTFFYVTTRKLINRRTVYGRIAHKLKANFIMFSLMLLVMSVAWLFLIMSWLQLDGLLYAHIVVNALQCPLLLYICVLRQRHVTFLLKKSCCYNEPPSTNDWGDELHYMNGNDY
ncbi:probable G-protein coupled receptor Mth-like 5 isoform X2 [Drosophila pseudoobscura]|uniref:Probable G-protein coupled receptor Mth-like 5 isoform X2 n=1 Tax=Drosophila pseudoobscura pseudoobscura TaxID=46245 RepID=A0A6I8UR81_DROPS|nr:probable G-protein coupled receptor Mth-like 5 isoform X2 [Drosophila pseudoobscura]